MSANFMIGEVKENRRPLGMCLVPTGRATRPIRQTYVFYRLEMLNRFRLIVAIMITLLLVLTQSARANPQEQAANAALADLGTTGVGLALGAAEANPLAILTLPIKYGLLKYAEKMPDGDKQEMQSTLAAIWSGASVNNVCVILSILTAGTFAPGCIFAGVAFGVSRWHASSSEREYWRTCSNKRRVMPTLLCEYKEPVT